MSDFVAVAADCSGFVSDFLCAVVPSAAQGRADLDLEIVPFPVFPLRKRILS